MVMKIQRFNEDIDLDGEYKIETNNDIRKLKTLFFEVFDDKLNIGNLVVLNVNPDIYKFFCKLYSSIDNITYDNYILLFNILQESEFEYSFQNKELNIMITDIKLFINELQKCVELKKYNL